MPLVDVRSPVRSHIGADHAGTGCKPYASRETAPTLSCWRFGDHRPLQFSSASLVTAGAFGFFDLTQSAVRPERYGEPLRFDTFPSSPRRQTCSNTMAPTWSSM